MSASAVILKPYGLADWEREALADLAEIRHQICTTEKDLIAHLPGVTILFGDVGVPITDRVIDSADALSAIVCCSTGVDYADVDAATQRGILVTYLPDYSVQAVAEHTFALAFALQRRIVRGDRSVREGTWDARRELVGTELAEKTLGVVGLGRIGRRVAEIGRALGMRVIGFSPHVPVGSLGDGAIERKRSLAELLQEADLVSIHTSLRDETRGLIGRAELDQMRPGAVLINVARGPIVDEDALVSALRDGRLAGAALDVLRDEPPPPDHPLLRLDNVVLTPHIAWATQEARKRAQHTIREQVAAIVERRTPPHVVNPEVISAWSKTAPVRR